MEPMRMVRILLAAQQSVDSGRPLKSSLVAHLLEEIMRLRKMVAATERRANREMSRNERMDLHRARDPEGTAEGSSDGVREG